MIKHIALSLLMLPLLVNAGQVYAQRQTAETEAPEPPPILDGIVVDQAYAYETSSKQKNGAAYFLVSNMSNDHDRLISASTKVAKKTEIHTMEADKKGVMKMRGVDGIDIPLGNTIGFTKTGHHVMLMGLKSPLKADKSFPLTLTFEKAGEVNVDVHIKAVYTPPTPPEATPETTLETEIVPAPSAEEITESDDDSAAKDTKTEETVIETQDAPAKTDTSTEDVSTDQTEEAVKVETNASTESTDQVTTKSTALPSVEAQIPSKAEEVLNTETTPVEAEKPEESAPTKTRRSKKPKSLIQKLFN